MRFPKNPVTVCALFNIVCIIVILYFMTVEYTIFPNTNKNYEYTYEELAAKDKFIKFRNSCIKSGTWDWERTSKISECQSMISGVPEKPPPFLSDLKNPCWYDKSGNFFCLPYFYIIGMVKCGTSDLNSHIMNHPDIATGRKDNQFWFHGRFEFSHGKLRLGTTWDYLRFFSRHSSSVLQAAKEGFKGKIFSDGSAATLYHNKYWWTFRENCNLTEPKYTTADYIHHLVPKAKIIAILRNPTDRAYSSYCFFKKPVKTPDDFHFQVRTAVNWFRNCTLNKSVRGCAYDLSVDRVSKVRIVVGLYYIFIKDYMEVFSKENVMVIRFEDYINNRLSTVKEVYRFLDLRPMTPEEEKQFLENDIVVQSNAALKDKVGPMRNDTRLMLDKFFKQYNAKLSNLLHDEKYMWWRQ